jgi:Tfp pilus assembly protein PilF
MKWVLSVLFILMVFGCGGVKQPNTSLAIPELSKSEFYDSPYIEGWANLKEGKPKVALKKFEQSNLEDEKLYLAFGYTFLLQNKLTLARQNFEKTLMINPDNLQAKLGIATIYESTDDLENAFHVYSQLRAEYPENDWIKMRYEYIRSVETRNQLEKAEAFNKKGNQRGYIQSLEKAAAYSDDMDEIKMKMADFYLGSDDLERAAACYEKIIEKHPGQEDILYKLAGLYEKMEKYDAAIVIYNRILELHPGDMNLSNKINDIKVKFYDTNLPVKFKNIFFKYSLNREDLAALIGHYFNRFLRLDSTPVIITDIAGSFARDEIIQLCTLNIMDFRPDHRFERFTDISRSALAVILNSIIGYLRGTGFQVKTTPRDELLEPEDISPQYKYYSVIKFVVNAGIMKLDSENRFNPTEKVSPAEGLAAIRNILNHIEKRSP